MGSTGLVMGGATMAYDSTGKITGISTRMFTMAPKLRSIIMNKLVIHAENDVQTPSDDRSCAKNCYAACGDFPTVASHEEEGETLTIRAFHINLKDVSKLVKSGVKKVS